MQTTIVAIIITIAVFIAARHIYRQLSGKSKGCECANCNNEGCGCCKENCPSKTQDK